MKGVEARSSHDVTDDTRLHVSKTVCMHTVPFLSVPFLSFPFLSLLSLPFPQLSPPPTYLATLLTAQFAERQTRAVEADALAFVPKKPVELTTLSWLKSPP